jgi:hypothetical protein
VEARIREAAEAHRRAEIDGLWARAREASLAPEWQEELERALSEADRYRREAGDLRRELAVARQNLVDMAAGCVAPADRTAPEVSGSPCPKTVAEAVVWAAGRCARLVILPECADSARHAAYRQPARVWRGLVAMNEVATSWARGKLDGGFAAAFAERGFDFAPRVSEITLGKYGHAYQRRWRGRLITLGPHLRLGRGSPETCCRIYFDLHRETHRFVVGHVGNHLADSTSG